MVTPFALSVREVEDALVTGAQSGPLEDYFGPEQYQELSQLAKEARSRSRRGGTRVLILPGIMGSKLGVDGNEIWLDPWDVLIGNLRKLSLTQGEPGVEAMGVFLLAYEKLKLRLLVSGYDADFFPFDWRLDITTLGRRLAEQIKGEGRPVHLVAHSMGGLVARACLAFHPDHLERVITLGTPNFGSYSPIQAFRGVHSVVSKIAMLDVSSSQEDLAEIFKTFPGLSVMLPSPDRAGGTDYFDLGAWPSKGVRPDQTMLTKSLQQQRQLSTDFDVVQIIGCNKETVVGARKVGDEFEYSLSREGDGTVPLVLARLADKRAYFIEETHGSLPNNWTVESAVIDILATGATSRLSEEPISSRSAQMRVVRERDLGADLGRAREASAISGTHRLPSAREAREVLDEFVSANATPAVVAALAARGSAEGGKPPAALEQIVVARRRQARLEVSIANCSLVDVDASAYVLGLFSEVAPSGPALVIDDLLDGAVMMMQERRMFSPSVGNISMLPKGRHPMRADFIAFAGLGAFDSFTPSTLETVGENLARTFIATRVDDFATVPIGGASGGYSVEALQAFLKGLVRGILDADGSHNFRRLTICEIDDHRYVQLRDALYQLGRTPLFDQVEVTLQELPAPRQKIAVTRTGAVRAAAAGQDPPVYLIVRQEGGEGPEDRDFALGASLLTAGYKATIVRDRKSVSRAALDTILKRLAHGAQLPVAELPPLGRALAELVLPPSILSLLANFRDNHLVVVHDAGASRIPWDTIHVGDMAPALGAGLSHRYESENLAIAKWLERRQQSPELKVLLVVNPTSDLAGAAEEGRRIKKLLDGMRSTKVVVVEGAAARHAELSRLFSSGEFDIVHYSGHAYFDQASPERSGILCAGNDVLSGRDLASLSNLPSLVFFNACEAARIRKIGAEPEPPRITARVRRSVGFAEAFLQGGVANYVGTYWPVGDTAALKFAEGFYTALLANKPLGQATLDGRQAVLDAGSADWSDYILYGDQNFVLKWSTP